MVKLRRGGRRKRHLHSSRGPDDLAHAGTTSGRVALRKPNLKTFFPLNSVSQERPIHLDFYKGACEFSSTVCDATMHF